MTTSIWFVRIEVVTFDISQLVVNELSKVSNGNFNGRSKSSFDRRPAFSLKDCNFNSSHSLLIECRLYKRDSTIESGNVVEDSYLHDMNYRKFLSVFEIVHRPTMRLLA